MFLTAQPKHIVPFALQLQVSAVADTPRYECTAPSPAIVFK
jgi:hypothetical protein